MKEMVERMVKLCCENIAFDRMEFVSALSGGSKEIAMGNWDGLRLIVNRGVCGTGMPVVGRTMKVKRG